MSNKVITIWLILLTAFVIFSEWSERENLQLRNRNTEIRDQKYKELTKSLDEALNGRLKEQLAKIKSYLHKH